MIVEFVLEVTNRKMTAVSATEPTKTRIAPGRVSEKIHRTASVSAEVLQYSGCGLLIKS